MEVKLQELIEQIKNDGVTAAKKEAEAIIDSARKEAERMVADAQTQADRILADAKLETERMTKASEDAIRQAGRNLLISFRESVTREVRAIIGENINAVYSSEAFAKLIVSVVERWANNAEVDDIAIILNTEELDELKGTLLAALKEKATKGVTLKPNDNFYGGFRIAINNGSTYYDYSSEAVVEMLSNYLSPKVTELLKEAE